MAPSILTQLYLVLLIGIFCVYSSGVNHHPIRTTYDSRSIQYGISILIFFEFEDNATTLTSSRINDTLSNLTQLLINEAIEDHDIQHCVETHSTINITCISNLMRLTTALSVCTPEAQQLLITDFNAYLQSQLMDILSNDTLPIVLNAIRLNISTVYGDISGTWTTMHTDTTDHISFYYGTKTGKNILTMALLFGISGGVLVVLMIFTIVTQINMHKRMDVMQRRLNAVQPQPLSKANNLLGLELSQSTLDISKKKYHRRNKLPIINGRSRALEKVKRKDVIEVNLKRPVMNNLKRAVSSPH